MLAANRAALTYPLFSTVATLMAPIVHLDLKERGAFIYPVAEDHKDSKTDLYQKLWRVLRERFNHNGYEVLSTFVWADK